MNKNSRGIAPILIVVILGLIGIVSYLFFTQSIKQELARQDFMSNIVYN